MRIRGYLVRVGGFSGMGTCGYKLVVGAKSPGEALELMDLGNNNGDPSITVESVQIEVIGELR